MCFYKNTQSEIKRFSHNTSFNVGDRINYHGKQLRVEDTNHFIDRPICGGCYFDKDSADKDAFSECSYDFIGMGCSAINRPDGKDIIYVEDGIL